MEPAPADPIRTLACPEHGEAPLEAGEGELACGLCGTAYPIFGSIPCLIADPALWRARWLGRLEEYLHVTGTRVRQFRAERELPGLLPRTRERLERMALAKAAEGAGVEALFAAVRSHPRYAASDLIIPVPQERPGRMPILDCYENVFRDWAWGGREIELVRAMVERLAPAPSGTLAVLGAGAGRLAVEAHRTLRAVRTFALDVNPLPLLVAEALLGGATVRLPEYPVRPRSGELAAVSHELVCPPPIPAGVTLVLGDALRPPFRPGSLDTVLTPWFIDAVDADVSETAAAVSRALRSGGCWVSVGPLEFNTPLHRSYSFDEVVELVAAAGFEVTAREQQPLPYFDSPHSGAHATELVYAFAARKTREAPPYARRDETPPWLRDPDLPIPVSPELTQVGRASVLASAVITLIDGTQSISDIARALAESWGVGEAAMRDDLRAFFSRLPR